MGGAKYKTSKDKQDRKQPMLPPGRNANQPTHIPKENVSVTSVNEVKYAQPGAMCRAPLNPQDLEVTSPSQYQGLRASGVNMTSPYNIPHVRKHEHGGEEVKTDPQYVNYLPV